MITIAETLEPEHVVLNAPFTNLADAVQTVAALLKNDARVLQWNELNGILRKSVTCLVEADASFGMCIPHARTDSVLHMVMSAERFDVGIPYRDCPKAIRYIFSI